MTLTTTTSSGAKQSKCHHEPYCTVLPPGEFNTIIPQTLPIYSHSLMQQFSRNQAHKQGCTVPSPRLSLDRANNSNNNNNTNNNCRAMLCKRGLCCHAVCVCARMCLYVCLSVTFVHSVETNKHIFKIFHHRLTTPL